MASKVDIIRMIMMSLPAILDGSKELMQNFRKAKIDDEDVKAALNDLLDQKKEMDAIRSAVDSLKAKIRIYFVVTTLLLLALIALVALTLQD